MQRGSIWLVVAAVVSVVLMFLPSLLYAVTCLLGECSYQDLRIAQSYQWLQTAWLLGLLHFAATRLGGYQKIREL